MKLVVLTVGAPRDRHMASLIREYETRAGHYFRFETVEVSAATGGGGTPDAVRASEAEQLKRRVPAGLDTWALTRDGEPATSRELATSLSDMATYSHAGVAFLIGGAYGLDSTLLASCTRRLSLSRMTLPHEMARLILTEQIYRAGTILRGEPYHKGGSR